MVVLTPDQVVQVVQVVVALVQQLVGPLHRALQTLAVEVEAVKTTVRVRADQELLFSWCQHQENNNS